MGEIIKERGEVHMRVWQRDTTTSAMIWDCCLTESRAYFGREVEQRDKWQDLDYGCVKSAEPHICGDEEV